MIPQGLDDTTLPAQTKYPMNYTQLGKRFVLCLHYDGSKTFLFVTATKVYQFKVKTSEIKDCVPSFGNVSVDFATDNMEKAGLKGVANFFSVDFNPIVTNNILDIHKHLMKRT